MGVFEATVKKQKLRFREKSLSNNVNKRHSTTERNQKVFYFQY